MKHRTNWKVIGAVSVILTALVSCALPNPKAALNTITRTQAAVSEGIRQAIALLEKSPPDVPAARDILKEELANNETLPASVKTVSDDYDILKAHDTKVTNSIGYRVEMFLIGSFWAAVATCICVVIFCVFFPAVTPFLIKIPGFIGGLTEHLTALLPLQNVYPTILNLTKKTQTVIPTAAEPAVKALVTSQTVPSAVPNGLQGISNQ